MRDRTRTGEDDALRPSAGKEETGDLQRSDIPTHYVTASSFLRRLLTQHETDFRRDS